MKRALLSSPAGSSAMIVAALVAIAGMPPAARAGDNDRCSGTLCDFYYRNADAAPATQQATPATPLTVPGAGVIGRLFSGSGDPPPAPGAAPTAARPFIDVQGGGLVSRFTGAPQPERCSGTLCDFYYGKSAPEPTEQPAQQAIVPGDPAPEPAADDTAPPRSRHREVVVEEKPSCVAPANDPWRCYR